MARQHFFADKDLLDELKAVSKKTGMKMSAIVTRGVRLALDEINGVQSGSVKASFSSSAPSLQQIPKNAQTKKLFKSYPAYAEHEGQIWFSIPEICSFLNLKPEAPDTFLDDEDRWLNGITPMTNSFGLNTLIGVAIDSGIDPSVANDLQHWADNLN